MGGRTPRAKSRDHLFGKDTAVAKNTRHNTAFVVGSVVGAVTGAAAALWKTPYTGAELRAKLSEKAPVGGSTAPYSSLSSETPSESVASTYEPSLKDKVVSKVEETLAPIVGVELGKTANGSTGASQATTRKPIPTPTTSFTNVGSAAGGGDAGSGARLDVAAAHAAAQPEPTHDSTAQTSGISASQPAAVVDDVDPDAVERGDVTLTGGTAAEKHADSWASAYGEDSIRAQSGASKWGYAEDDAVEKPTSIAEPHLSDSYSAPVEEVVQTETVTDTRDDSGLRAETLSSEDERIDSGTYGGASTPAALADDVSQDAVERGDVTLSGGTAAEKHAESWEAAYGDDSIRTPRVDASAWGYAEDDARDEATRETRPVGDTRSETNINSFEAGDVMVERDETVRVSADGEHRGSDVEVTQVHQMDTLSTAEERIDARDARAAEGQTPALHNEEERAQMIEDTGAGDAGVAPVGHDGSNLQDTHPEAASVDTLLTPQADHVPEAVRASDPGSMHPFPKLGGKE